MPTSPAPESIKLLTTYIDNFFTNKEDTHSFFIVSGPQNIDKSTIIQELIRERIGQFFYHDFLHIKDLSVIIGKKHSLKIETPKDKEDRYIEREDGEIYEDIGIREINHWLQQSGLGKYKVVLIENIERIVPAAANALLKSLEEPLPGRLIIATVSHSSQLLETIISRALVIRFPSLLPHDIKGFEEMYGDTIEVLKKPGFLFQKQDALKKIHESGSLSTFLDNRIAYCAYHDRILEAEKWIKIKKMINSNVNIENLLLYGVL